MVVMEVELPIITYFSNGIIGHGEDSPLKIGSEILGENRCAVHTFDSFFESVGCPREGPDILLYAIDGLGQGRNLVIRGVGHRIPGLCLGRIDSIFQTGNLIFVIPLELQRIVIRILDLG